MTREKMICCCFTKANQNDGIALLLEMMEMQNLIMLLGNHEVRFYTLFALQGSESDPCDKCDCE